MKISTGKFLILFEAPAGRSLHEMNCDLICLYFLLSLFPLMHI